MGCVCPATMCPLFASDGSPWTGNKNAPCPRHDDLDTDGCPWWSMGCQNGGPHFQVSEAIEAGRPGLVLGPKRQQPKPNGVTPRGYDCPRSKECSWQRQSGESPCPPRRALAAGIDPRAAAF